LSGLVVIEAARRDNHRRLASLAIFFWGMALVAKFNGVLVVIPALVFYGVYFVARKDRRRLGIFIVFAGPLILLFSSLPLVARNYFETGNPFYPMMNRIFASPWVSASFAVLIENVEPVRSPFLETLFRRLVEFSKQGAIFFIALPGIFFAGAKLYRQRTVRAQPIIFLGLFSFLTYVIAGNASQDIRYLGLGLLLLGGVGAMFLLEELSLWTPKKFTLYISIGLFIAIAATSKLPLHLYRKLATQAWGADAILLHTAGQAKAWIRTHAGPDDLTIMVADNEAYYLSGAKTTILTERPDIDAATRRASNLEEFLRGICWNARDAKFLLDARPEMGLVHLFPVSKARLDLSTVFSSSSGRVVSIEKLVGLSQDPETKAACPHLKAGSP
jgi:hypothetical protein